MRSHRVILAGVIAVFAIGIVVASFDAIAQSRTGSSAAGKTASAPAQGGIVRLSARSKPAPEASSREAAPAAFEGAALLNVQLQATLDWTFGGKQQRGWYLYTPLVANLIGAESGGAASEFAMRLSLWQEQKAFEPTGVLDNGTWSQMISTFQSQRLKNKSYPTADQLVTLLISDCYDSSRPEELRKVERETFAAYKRLVAAAAAESSLGLQVAGDGQLALSEKFLKIISAYRSQEYQDELRRQSPNSGRAGLAFNSPHSTGRALDLYVGGEPVDTKDENRALQTQTRVYRWLVKNAARFGFQPYFYEPWHWEYTGTR
ncbi:MAG: D-alanyl-D-alanine carboxypeptidase family protein [Acidobacteriota bacterium]